jgi:hypothetical protein
MKTKRTGADLEADAKEFANNHPYDREGSLALAAKLENEAKAMKQYPTMSMRTVNRLLVIRFQDAKNKSK